MNKQAITSKIKPILSKLLPALITYFIMQVVLYNKIHFIFQFPEQKTLTFYFLYACAILFGITFLTFLYTVLWKLLKKDERFLSYFKYFIPYFLIMAVFFILTWPGIFKGDEFYVIRAALSFDMSPAQSGLTSIFYISCLLFFPSMATITGVQLLIICSIFAYIMKNLNDLYHSKWIYTMYIPCLLLPVIDGNLFTLRSTLVGWLFAFLLFKLFFAYQNYVRSESKISLTDVTIFALVGGLICAWRTEFIYLILLLPLTLWFLKTCNLKKAVLLLCAMAVSFGLFQTPNKIAADGSNKYPISLVLNPLANLFTEEHLAGPQVYEDILTINELVDVQLLRKSASVRNISQYWNIPDVLPDEQLSRFMEASLRIILYNPQAFLKYRVQTFAYTNGFYENRINHPGGEMVSGILNLEYYGEDYKTKFLAVNPLLSQSLREKTIEFLACRDYEQNGSKTGTALLIFYNCVPTLVLLLICMIAALFLKKKEFVCIGILCLIQVAFIFLTAPAMFFMYYYCFYFCGYLICALFVVDMVVHKKLGSVLRQENRNS